MERLKVAQASAIPEGGSAVVAVNGKEIALFKIDSKIHAIDNLCSHRGGPLNEGYLEDGVVTCPWHAWQFDVTTGDCRTVPVSRQACYRVAREGDDVLIEVD
jgi:nitrite reductase/ring-hydroxylating ferredoxin subunit